MLFRVRFLKFLLILPLLIFTKPSLAVGGCKNILPPTANERDLELGRKMSHEVARQTESILEKQVVKSSSKKGYAVLIGAMVGSAAMTTYLGSQLPTELQFTSIFISQLSTLGVYVLGAPIWEPLASKFRLWAFGISQEKMAQDKSSAQLEATWTSTQENYSLNAQMSRNIINQFIIAVKENFYQAYRAYTESDQSYSADQVAEAAYRMRILFRDIHPSDPSVAVAINTAFTNHIQVNEDFIALVWKRLKLIDPEWSQPHVKLYYDLALTSWLVNR